jgi:hypothetical protein
VAGFVLDRAREKNWAATCPRNGLPKHCYRNAQGLLQSRKERGE